MYVSEDMFSHLREAADERQRRELEFRRLAYESRQARTGASTIRRGLSERIRGFRRTARLAPKPIPHA